MPALIGDNDFLCQPDGLLTPGTFCKPFVLCVGRRLYCSHKYATCCFERESDSKGDEIWVNRGEVRAKDGSPLNYHLYKERIWTEKLFTENHLPARALDAFGFTMVYMTPVDFGGVGNDGVICGSELSVPTFIRKSFLLNKRYLAAEFDIGPMEELDR